MAHFVATRHNIMSHFVAKNLLIVGQSLSICVKHFSIYIETLNKGGNFMHQKPNRNVSIAVRINEEEKERLDAYCIEHDLTISAVVRAALKQFLNN